MRIGVHSFSLNCRFPALGLAFFWISGLLFGALYSFSTIDYFSSLMRMLLHSRVSIVSFVFILSFHLIVLSASFRFLPKPFFFLLSFLKAFVYSFCLVCTYLSFGTAGWLIHFLLTYTDTCTIIPFLWFSLRSILGYSHTLKRDAVVYLSIYIAVYVIDLLWVSPYWTYVISYY